MSNKDERIVQMTFDNKKFESNAKTTMKTLDDLNKKLNFDKTVDGLKEFEKTANKLSFDKMFGNIDKIASRLEIPGKMIDKLFSDIANKAVQTGETIVRALTITPVFDGFREYENKIQSIQVIAANTGVLMRDLEKQQSQSYDWTEREIQAANDIWEKGMYGNGADRVNNLTDANYDYARVQAKVNDMLYTYNREGEDVDLTIDDIQDGLDELNRYADDTIYNFAQMTSAIGTFTTAGVDFYTALADVKGIANLAAIVGAPASDASRAMFQLSQGLSTGYISLQDWLSIEHTAGMGGKIFQDTILDTARHYGIAVDEMIEEDGKFRNTLQRGWLSADILNEALAKLSGDYDADYWKDLGYSDEQIEQILRLGEVATDAATKVRTLTQLRESTLEAVGSSWAKSWEIIFGDFYEAPKLLTRINDSLGAVINGLGEARNRALEMWEQLHGRTAFIETFANVFKGIGNILMAVASGFAAIFDLRPARLGIILSDISKSMYAFSEKFLAFTEKLDWLTNIAAAVAAVGKVILTIIKQSITLVWTFANTLFKGFGGVIPVLEQLSEWILMAAYYLLDFVENSKIFEAAQAGVVIAAEAIRNVFSFLGTAVLYAASKLGDFVKYLSGMKFTDIIMTIVGFFAMVIESAVNFIKDLSFDKAIAKISSLPSRISNAFAGAKEQLAKVFHFRKGESPSESMEGETKKMGIVAKIMEKVGYLFGFILETIEKLWKKIRTFVKESNLLWSVLGALMSITTIDMTHNISKFFNSLSNVGDILKAVAKVVDRASYVIKQLGNVLAAFAMDIKAGALIKIAIAIGLLTASIWALSALPKDKVLAGLEVISALLAEMWFVMRFSALTVGSAVALAASMMMMATSIALLAVPLIALSFIPADKMARGMGALLILIKILQGFAKSLAKTFINKTGAKHTKVFMDGIGTTVLAVAATLVILAAAVNMLMIPITVFAFLPQNMLAKGMAAVIVLILLLKHCVKSIVKGFDGIKIDKLAVVAVVGAFLMLMLTLVLIIPAILIFSLMPTEKIVKGGLAVLAIIAVIVLAVHVMTKDASHLPGPKKLLGFASIVAALALTITAMIHGILLVAWIPEENLKRAGNAMFMVMFVATLYFAAVAIIEKYINKGNAGAGFKIAGTLIGIALGITALLGAIIVLSQIPADKLFKAVGAIGILMLALSAVLIALAEFQRRRAGLAGMRAGSGPDPFDWKKWAALAGVILAVGAAFFILANGLYKMADAMMLLDNSSTATKMLFGGTLVVTLLALTLGLWGLIKAISSEKANFKRILALSAAILSMGVAMVLVASAVLIFANAVEKLNDIKLGAVLTGIIALVVPLGALILLLALFAKLPSKPIFAIAAALAAMGLCVASIALLILSISKLADTLMTLNSADLSNISKQFGILLDAISDNMTKIDTIVQQFGIIIMRLIAYIMKQAILLTCAKIIAAAEPIALAVEEVLRVFSLHAYAFADYIATILEEIMDALEPHMEPLMQKAIDLLIAFLNGFANAVNNRKGEIGEAVANAVQAIGNVIIEIVIGAIAGIVGIFDETAKEAILGWLNDFREWGEKMKNGGEGYDQPYAQESFDDYMNAPITPAEKRAQDEAIKAAKAHGNLTEQQLKDMEDIYYYQRLIAYNSGHKKHLDWMEEETNATDEQTAAMDAQAKSATKLNDILAAFSYGDTKSSDKKGGLMNFFTKGIDKFKKKAKGLNIKDIFGIGEDGFSFDKLKEQIGVDIPDMGDISSQFADMTPVMDMSDSDFNFDNLNAASNLPESLDTNTSYTRESAEDVNGIREDSQNRVVDSIASLGEKITNMAEQIMRIKVQLDTGVLVGEMVDPLDAALGAKAAARNRGA